jgi:hypothetical protein
VSRTTVQTAAAAAVAAATLTVAANWRFALLAVLTAAAIAATRVRYARLAALALLVLALGLAGAGLGADSDDRATAQTTSCPSSSAAREDNLRLAAVRAPGASCAAARALLGVWRARGPRARRQPVHGLRCRAHAASRVTCRRGQLRFSAHVRRGR